MTQIYSGDERELSPLLVSHASGGQLPDHFLPTAQITAEGPLSPAYRAPLSADQSSCRLIVPSPSLDQQPRWMQRLGWETWLVPSKFFASIHRPPRGKRNMCAGFSMGFPWLDCSNLRVGSPSFDLHGFHPTAQRPRACKFHFRFGRAGDSNAGAKPLAPHHCNTKGRVDLPQFCYNCPIDCIYCTMVVGAPYEAGHQC